MMLERKVITEAMTSYEQNEDMQKGILKKKVGITRIIAPIYSTSRVVKTVDKHTGLFSHPQI